MSVPAEKLVSEPLIVRVVPAPALRVPPVLVTAPLSVSVPLCTSKVPVLVKAGAMLATPLPTDLVSVPVLARVPVPLIVKSPLIVLVPETFNVRFCVTFPDRANPPCARVVPLPCIVPPDQV